MMGERESQTPLWNYRVNLDKRVRRDHQLRRINEVLELSFVACTGTNPQLAYRCAELLQRLRRLLLDHLSALLPI